MGEKLTEWLDIRGLDLELAARMGWEEKRTKAGDPVVAIPYHVRGEPRWHKARTIGGDKQFFAFPGGVEHDLWNVDVLYDETLADHPIVITEGECDALACVQSGKVRTVSIPDGWTASLIRREEGVDKAKALLKHEKAFLDAPYVVVAGDNDAPGRAFAQFMTSFLDVGDVRVCQWPDGCKDANDVLLKHGETELVRRIDAAKRIDPPGGEIINIGNIPAMPDRVVWRTGHKETDRMVALEAGVLSVLTGIPGHGKTTWATWCLHRIVKNHGVRVAVGAFETNAIRIRDQVVRMNANHDLDFMSAEVYQQTLDSVADHWYLMRKRDWDDPNQAHDMGWLKSMIKRAAIQEGCNIILIDPWNEIEHMLLPGESMTNYTNVALANIRRWAELYNVHIMLTAHPRKISPDLKHPPGGYDIADSAAWYNKPSLGLTVHQDMDENDQRYVRLMNWKTRDRELYGIEPGETRLVFNANQLSYVTYRQEAAA